jgi:hypothetical protein
MGLLFGGTERRDWTQTPAIPPNSQAGGRFQAAGEPVADRGVAAEDRDLRLRAPAPRGRLDRCPSTSSASRATRRPVPTPKWLTDPGGDGYGLTDWLGQVTYCDAMRGNVVALVAGRDATGRRGSWCFSTQTGHGPPQLRRPAEWHLIGGSTVPTEDVWHRRSFSVPGRSGACRRSARTPSPSASASPPSSSAPSSSSTAATRRRCSRTPRRRSLPRRRPSSADPGRAVRQP